MHCVLHVGRAVASSNRTTDKTLAENRTHTQSCGECTSSKRDAQRATERECDAALRGSSWLFVALCGSSTLFVALLAHFIAAHFFVAHLLVHVLFECSYCFLVRPACETNEAQRHHPCAARRTLEYSTLARRSSTTALTSGFRPLLRNASLHITLEPNAQTALVWFLAVRAFQLRDLFELVLEHCAACLIARKTCAQINDGLGSTNHTRLLFTSSGIALRLEWRSVK